MAMWLSEARNCCQYNSSLNLQPAAKSHSEPREPFPVLRSPHLILTPFGAGQRIVPGKGRHRDFRNYRVFASVRFTCVVWPARTSTGIDCEIEPFLASI